MNREGAPGEGESMRLERSRKEYCLFMNFCIRVDEWRLVCACLCVCACVRNMVIL